MIALAALAAQPSIGAESPTARPHASAVAGPAPTTPASTPTSGSGTTPANPTPAPKKPVTLYRIVGCRSHGGLYTHGPWVKRVAVGFDDGPAPLTPSFVRMLEREQVRATFFTIGRQVTGSYRELLLRELRDGDVLGDHTWSHPNLAAGGDVRGQLASTLAAIRQVTGYTPCIVRPPYGAYNGGTISIARSLGLATVTWNVDPTDWATPGTGAIVARVLAQVRPGSIILSHDGGGYRGQTLAAYPQIISALRSRGYRFVTINELLGFKPVYRSCIKLCAGIGVPRSRVPRDAIIERAP